MTHSAHNSDASLSQMPSIWSTIWMIQNKMWMRCFSSREVNETTKRTTEKSPWVSLKAAAAKHLCLRGSGKHTGRHHSCKISSGASSNGQRLTLIHEQIPLALRCCRFRTAVPPNISLPCLANIEKKKKKKDSTSALSPQEQQKKGGKTTTCAHKIERGGDKMKGE